MLRRSARVRSRKREFSDISDSNVEGSRKRRCFPQDIATSDEVDGGDVDEELALAALPRELLHHTFSFLEGEDLRRCLFTCKRWLDVANSPSLWENICVNKWEWIDHHVYRSDWKRVFLTSNRLGRSFRQTFTFRQEDFAVPDPNTRSFNLQEKAESRIFHVGETKWKFQVLRRVCFYIDSMILRMECIHPQRTADDKKTCMYGVSLRNRRGPRKSRTLIQVKPVCIFDVAATLAKNFSWNHVCDPSMGFLREDGSFSIVVHMSLYTVELQMLKKQMGVRMCNGAYRSAIDSANEMLQLHPWPYHFLRYLSSALVCLGEFEKALQALSECLNLCHHSEALCHRGQVLFFAHKLEEAVKDASDVLPITTDASHLACAYNNRAMARILMGDYHQAYRDASSAINYDRFRSYSYNTRALANLRLEKYEDAIKDAKESLSYMPSHRSHHRMSEAYMHLGKLEQARSHAIAGIKQLRVIEDDGTLEAQMAIAHGQFGRVCMAEKKYREATRHLQRAIKLAWRSHSPSVWPDYAVDKDAEVFNWTKLLETARKMARQEQQRSAQTSAAQSSDE